MIFANRLNSHGHEVTSTECNDNLSLTFFSFTTNDKLLFIPEPLLLVDAISALFIWAVSNISCIPDGISVNPTRARKCHHT